MDLHLEWGLCLRMALSCLIGRTVLEKLICLWCSIRLISLSICTETHLILKDMPLCFWILAFSCFLLERKGSSTVDWSQFSWRWSVECIRLRLKIVLGRKQRIKGSLRSWKDCTWTRISRRNKILKRKIFNWRLHKRIFCHIFIKLGLRLARL